MWWLSASINTVNLYVTVTNAVVPVVVALRETLNRQNINILRKEVVMRSCAR